MHKTTREDTKVSIGRNRSPVLHRKRRASSISDIHNLKILDNATLEPNNCTSSSKSHGRTPWTVSRQRRRRCERRYLMTTNMLKRDCNKIRRLYQQSNYNVVPVHNSHQRKKKCKVSATSEESTEKQNSAELLLNECTQSVKDLRLVVTLPSETPPWPRQSSTKLQKAYNNNKGVNMNKN